MPIHRNCWEHFTCGREPNGSNVEELGVCPAATEPRLDGIHDGTNAGRACWVVAGTLCNDEIQGAFTDKHATCVGCDFYQKVKEECSNDFQYSVSLLNMLL